MARMAIAYVLYAVLYGEANSINGLCTPRCDQTKQKL